MIDFTEIDKEFKVVVGKGLRPFLIYKKNWQYDAGCTVYTVSEAFEKVKNGEGNFFIASITYPSNTSKSTFL